MISETEDVTVTQRLASSGLRPTPQREVVYQTILSKRDHPTAEQVFMRAKKSMPEISMATVYNCLELLEDLGWLRRLRAHDGQITFELNGPSHHHARCSKCDQILDLKLDEELLAQLLASSQGLDRFDAHRVDLWLTGVCVACR